MRKQILKNFISSWVSKGIKLFTSLLLIPIFIKELGKDGYGLVVLLTTILGLAALGDFGIRASLVRQLTIAGTKNDKKEFNSYFNTALGLYLIVWVVFSILLFLFAPFLAKVFKANGAFFSETVFLLRTFGILSLFWTFTTPLAIAITTSLNRFDISTYRETIINTISILFMIIAIKYLKWGLHGWALVSIVFQFITVASIWIIGLKFAPHLKISPRYFKRDLIKPIFAFGGIVAIGGWAWKMKNDAAPLIVSSIFGPSAVALFRVGTAVPLHTRPLISSVCGQIYPVATAAFAKNDTDKTRQIFETASKYTLLMGALVVTGFLFLAEPFLQLWLGNRLSAKDVHTAALCMQLMATVDFCFYIEGASYSILYGMNRLRFRVLSDICLGVVNVVASYSLVKFTRLGIQAVLIPTIVIEGLVRPFFLFYTAKQINYSAIAVWKEILQPVLLLLLCLLTVGYLFTSIVKISNLAGFLCCLVALGSAWLVSTWVIGLTAKDRQMVLSAIRFK